MQQHTTTTNDPPGACCPSRQTSVELPLATIEELDNLAALNHLTRDEILRQIINAALLSDTPQLPADEDQVDRLAEHAHLTRHRSLELAHGSAQR